MCIRDRFSGNASVGSYYGILNGKPRCETYGGKKDPKIQYFNSLGHFRRLYLSGKSIKPEQKDEVYPVDKEFILSAHRAANSEMKETIEKKYPTLFPKDQKFNFGRSFTIGTTDSQPGPFVIANSWALPDWELKSLIVNTCWKADIVEDSRGRQHIQFIKK